MHNYDAGDVCTSARKLDNQSVQEGWAQSNREKSWLGSQEICLCICFRFFFYNFKRLKATSKNHMQPKCQFSFRSKKRKILTVSNGPCIIDFSQKVRQRTRNTIWVLKEIWVNQFAKNQRICVQTTYEFYDLKKRGKNHQKLLNSPDMAPDTSGNAFQ